MIAQKGPSAFGPRTQAVALALLVLLVAGPVLGNSWVQDEGPLVLENAKVHLWSGLWTGFITSWWPAETNSGLYRPLAQSLATLTWMLGGGAVVAFKIVNLLCYGLAVAAVWSLARRLLPSTSAWVAAALFAVHPVHTEAVAAAVNQGESIVTALIVLALVFWLDWSAGRRSARRTLPLVGVLYLVALGFKENALLLPAFLGAATLLPLIPLLPNGEPAPTRRLHFQAIGAITLIGALFWSMRTWVLGGALEAAAALGLPAEFGPRALTMLGVVPHWTRLLIWPAHLQADYAPMEIVPWAGWTTMQTLGLATLLLWGGLLVWNWRRAPRAAFALLWIAIALAPVSNLVLTTGILLAERTLMLASVGVVLVVGMLLPERLWAIPRIRTPLAVTIGVLLLAGGLRSAHRYRIWADQPSYLTGLANDSPLSSQSLTAVGTYELEQGDRRNGEARLRAAIAIAPDRSRAYRNLARQYRIDGLCDPAIPLLERAVALEPIDQYSRLSLVACLLDRGRYAEARVRAVEGAAGPGRALQTAFQAARVTTDSAARVRAPVGTVRIPPYQGDHTLIGPALQGSGRP